MKLLLITIISVLALSGKIFSQCNPTIPANAFVINTTQTTGFGGSQIWVCSNDTLTSNGGSNTIYLEIGAYLFAGGGSNTIYCPPGATVNLSSGSNTIFFVNSVDLVNPGGGPTLNPCTSIVYDYSGAPTPGCSFTTGFNYESVSGNTGLENIYPNPASDFLQVDYFLSSAENVTLGVINYSGAEIVSIKNGIHSAGKYSLKLETVTMPVGIYAVQIKTGSAAAILKFAIVR